MSIASARITGLRDIASSYDAILCDVWGVLHNGIAAWPAAIDALTRFRRDGGIVVMITNAPRAFAQVVEQLARLGVPAGTFDAVVTSGDVTRRLIAEKSKKPFHIGTSSDKSLYAGLDVHLSEPRDADAIVCTGLRNDRTETPADYAALLAGLATLKLPFICANPDIVVELGDSLLWCAGALARDYAALGGKTFIAGKPHSLIYRSARAKLDAIVGKTIETRRILAIGDGMPTDVKGAASAGLDLLYVSAGIHAGEYGESDTPDATALDCFMAKHNATPAAWLPRLVW